MTDNDDLSPEEMFDHLAVFLDEHFPHLLIIAADHNGDVQYIHKGQVDRLIEVYTATMDERDEPAE